MPGFKRMRSHHLAAFRPRVLRVLVKVLRLIKVMKVMSFSGAGRDVICTIS